MRSVAGIAREATSTRHLGLMLVIASIAAVSCGTSAFTVVGTTTQGATVYLVVSGNSDDVAQEKAYYANGGSGRIVDGDQHSGKLICEHDSAGNGHHLHFALYGDGISTEQCQQIFASFP